MITKEILQSKLDYDPETGIFTKKTNSWKFKIGDVAGCKSPKGYILIGIKNKQYLAHRLAWFYVYGDLPQFIDHINGNPSDNRICNLRKCTKSENSKNRGKQKNNTSGVKGVTWDKQCNKWKAQIKFNGKVKNLGVFKDLEFAALVVKEARTKFHGVFAKD